MLRASLALAVVGLVLVGLVGTGSQTAQASAGINKTINFQGRLLTNAGAVVADGNYNMKFIIYQDGDGLSANNSTGSPASSTKWTELWQNSVSTGSSSGVVVKNGYFSVNLGTYCALAGSSCQGNSNAGVNFDWDTLWLSMNVGGTAVTNTPTYDGEMLPMKRMASSVYALQASNADALGGIAASGFIQNATTQQAAANFNILSGAATTVAAAQIQTVASATAPVLILKGGATPGAGADLLQLQSSSGTVARVDSSGNLFVASSVDTQTGVPLVLGNTNATGITLTQSATFSGTSARTITGPTSGGLTVNDTGGNLTLSTTTSGTLAVTSAGALNLSTTSASSSTKVSAAASATAAALVVAGGATPGVGGDLLQLQDSTGSSVLRVDSSGNEEKSGYIDNGFGGIGSFGNLVPCSEQFDAGCSGTNWVMSNVTAPTANTQVAPDGNTTAESLVSTVNGGSACQYSATAAATTTSTFSVWLRSSAGSPSVDIRIDGGATSCGTAATVTGTKATVVLSTTWQRFSVTQAIGACASCNIKAFIFPGTTSSTGTAYAWGGQLALASNPGVYVRTTDSTVAASQGVVSNGGAFVSSINATDVPLVVQGSHSQSGDLLQLQNSSGSPLFKVSSAGAVTSVGVNSGAGLIQGTGGVTFTGTTQINATTGGTTTIGSTSAGTISVQGGSAGTTVNDTAGTLTLSTTTSGAISVTSAGTLAFSSSDFVVSAAGTVTTGTWQATAVGAQYGGTGQSVYAQGDLLYASTTTALSRLADIALGSCLTSGGVGANPSWGTCSVGGLVQAPATSGANTATAVGAGTSALTLINAASSTVPVLIVRGGTTPALGGDLLQLQDSTQASLLRVDSSGNTQSLGYLDNANGGIGAFGNLVPCSEQFDAGCSGTKWVMSNVTAPTANTQSAPDGTTTAESLVSTVNGGYACQFSATAAGSTTSTFSVWLKASAGTQSVDMRIDGGPTSCATAATVTGTKINVTATTTWQRFSVTQAIGTCAGCFLKAFIFPGTTASTGTAYAWGGQLSLSSNPGVYVRTTDSTVAASQGVVSNGGAFISSINATDVPLVIQGAHSQSGDLLQLQSSAGSGSVLFKVSSAGAITAPTTTNTINTLIISASAQLTNVGSVITGAGALTVSSGGATALGLDTGGAAAINIGPTNATSIVLGGNTSAAVTVDVANSSTTAYTLQTAGATSYLVADTTNGKLLVGGTTASTTPVILVAGNYNGSAGTYPTEVDGGMYYDSTAGGFKCGNNTAWVACGGGDVLVDSPTGASCWSFGAGGCLAAGANVDWNAHIAGWTQPVNDCQAGVVYQMQAAGYFVAGSTSVQMNFQVYSNGTAVGHSGITTGTTNGPTFSWNVYATLTCVTTTTVILSGFSTIDAPSIAAPQVAPWGGVGSYFSTTAGVHNGGVLDFGIGFSAGMGGAAAGMYPMSESIQRLAPP